MEKTEYKITVTHKDGSDSSTVYSDHKKALDEAIGFVGADAKVELTVITYSKPVQLWPPTF